MGADKINLNYLPGVGDRQIGNKARFRDMEELRYCNSEQKKVYLSYNILCDLFITMLRGLGTFILSLPIPISLELAMAKSLTG